MNFLNFDDLQYERKSGDLQGCLDAVETRSVFPNQFETVETVLRLSTE